MREPHDAAMKKTTHPAAAFSRRPHRAIPATARRRGASLVEVLVVMVVLLIGIFSIIRVFPLGFQSINQAGNRSIATRLARQFAEQFKSDSAGLPLRVLPTYDPDTDPLPENLDPDNLAPFLLKDGSYSASSYYQDINKARRIEGERVRIALPTTTSGGVSGSLYTLRFGPFYIPEAVTNDETNPDTEKFLRVYGAPFQGQATESFNGPAQIGALRGQPNAYLIDLGDDNEPAQILFPPANKERKYRVDFSYTEEDSANAQNLKTVSLPEPITMTVPANTTDWLPIKNDDATDPKRGAAYTDIVLGSDSVSRFFERLPQGAQFSYDANDPSRYDPYQYKLLSKNIARAEGAAGDVFANVGILAFNPAGATATVRTAYGEQPFTAYVDYDVLDWHILRDDREVPSALFGGGNGNGPNDGIPVRLTLGGIKRYGFSQELRRGIGNEGSPNEFMLRTYKGLYGGYANSKDDIQVFNLQGTGENYLGNPLNQGDYDKRASSDSDADYWVSYEGRTGSYRTGTIYVNPNKVAPGTQIRVLYKASGDWGVALQKASSAYKPIVNQDGVLPQSLDPGQVARGGAPGQVNRLYFSRTELNKSVVVTFEYTRNDRVTNGLDTRVRTSPTQITINQIGRGINEERLAYIDLLQAGLMPPPDMDEPQRSSSRYLMAGIKKDPGAWDVFGNPQGVSLKVRVVYRDNGVRIPEFPRPGETGVARTFARQWRIQDVDTYITPAPDAP